MIGRYIVPYLAREGAETEYDLGHPVQVLVHEAPFLVCVEPYYIRKVIDTRDVYVRFVSEAYFNAFKGE